ncbi:hypothetical protein [Spirosoma harenae]
MVYTKLKFEKILELYVFRVAEGFIDRVDAETQAKLIRMINDINNEKK